MRARKKKYVFYLLPSQVGNLKMTILLLYLDWIPSAAIWGFLIVYGMFFMININRLRLSQDNKLHQIQYYIKYCHWAVVGCDKKEKKLLYCFQAYFEWVCCFSSRNSSTYTKRKKNLIFTTSPIHTIISTSGGPAKKCQINR